MIDIDQVKARGIAWTVEQIRRVATGPAYMTFDIVEVAPPFDGRGQITALLAANLMFEFLCVLAASPQP